MARLQVRTRFGSSALRMLVGALVAISLLGATFAVSAAQVPGFDNGMPPGFDDNGMPPGFDENGNPPAVENQGPSPEEMCRAVFPDGIITGDPFVGDIDCSFFFPSEPEPEPEPTKAPPPAHEPTKTPDHDDGKDHGDKDHDDDKDHDKDHGDKKHEDEKADVGGKAAPTVTTMPTTGHGAAADTGVATSSLLAIAAVVMAALAVVASRLSTVRARR